MFIIKSHITRKPAIFKCVNPNTINVTRKYCTPVIFAILSPNIGSPTHRGVCYLCDQIKSSFRERRHARVCGIPFHSTPLMHISFCLAGWSTHSKRHTRMPANIYTAGLVYRTNSVHIREHMRERTPMKTARAICTTNICRRMKMGASDCICVSEAYVRYSFTAFWVVFVSCASNVFTTLRESQEREREPEQNLTE